ncbi:DUF1127 domain-containing protein [Bradyrhizobium sp. LHD-71]|uniref:DUF1127 domain-containing protein n=1 Tax=Bradyrhizobium sp. LHD-71 TaxID=3072141 RepID=UPI00280C80B8|nr:DUF1127 domain-containing protein [Bradyrhizobium sp. LHD-71]MDQ8728159.1 DUF1127 domain-containing protein [Bradyrhizobium sp. LHD-71]
MQSSRRSDDSFRPRSASLDCGGPRIVPSLITRRTVGAFGNTDRAGTQGLFWGTRFLYWCVWCSERSRQRDVLSKLDDRLLKDIGVTRQQADAEAAKPFWK